MDPTLLLHKPVFYGSGLANLGFLLLLVLHILPAFVAPLAGIVSLLSQKGHKLHVRSGRVFLWTMVVTATTGILLDLIRLSFFIKENHTSYPGYSMPNSYPARLAFLFAALCTLYLLREGTHRRVFLRRAAPPAGARALWMPGLLLAVGLGLTAFIFARLNPWTGALWMIWTFLLLVLLSLRYRMVSETRPGAGIAQHGVAMTSLAAFSWWGALQGFGPALFIALFGVNSSSAPYTGDQPGPYSHSFWFFLLAWAPSFLLAALLVRRFARKSRPTLPVRVKSPSPQ